jgi:tripartite-type tricarboxylate transporter receptor subunit TctC
MNRLFRAMSLVIALAASAQTQQATAQNDAASGYPGKPVTIIIGFPPGTATDSVGRVLAERLSQRLGQSFVVDNKPGQGGSMGAAAGARAMPDGYTLLLSATAPLAINQHLYQKLTYDSTRDFAPIGLTSWLPYALVVNSNSGINTLEEFLARARAKPGEMTYASIGNGTTGHLLVSMLMQQTGIKLNHIPYKGSAQAQTDLLGGRVDATFDTLVSVMPHVKAGTLKALAVSTLNRSKYAPEIASLNELGLTGFDAGAWLGLLAPVGTPAPIIDKLNRELNAVLDEPATQRRLLAMGAEMLKGSPADFSSHIRSEQEKWGKRVREAGVKIE